MFIGRRRQELLRSGGARVARDFKYCAPPSFSICLVQENSSQIDSLERGLLQGHYSDILSAAKLFNLSPITRLLGHGKLFVACFAFCPLKTSLL